MREPSERVNRVATSRKATQKAALTFVDLFCGGGLGARGAVRAGARPLLAVDAWAVATQTYQANFPETSVLTARIEDVDPGRLGRRYSPDVLLTSPECTSHSIARGARGGSEKSRETAIGIIPWIRGLKPRWVVVENVNRMRQWSRHSELIDSIEAQGYAVSDLLLNAADFGSAQARKRMFLVCDRNGTVVSRDELISLQPRQVRTARDVIDERLDSSSRPLYSAGRAAATLARAERAIAALGTGVSFLVVYYSSDYAGGWQTLDVPLRTITTVDRFGLVTWCKGVPMLRMLQPSELLAAMDSSNDHVLPIGSRREKVKLCGNGVCSEVMTAIFQWMQEVSTVELPVKRV